MGTKSKGQMEAGFDTCFYDEMVTKMYDRLIDEAYHQA